MAMVLWKSHKLQMEFIALAAVVRTKDPQNFTQTGVMFCANIKSCPFSILSNNFKFRVV